MTHQNYVSALKHNCNVMLWSLGKSNSSCMSFALDCLSRSRQQPHHFRIRHNNSPYIYVGGGGGVSKMKWGRGVYTDVHSSIRAC